MTSNNKLTQKNQKEQSQENSVAAKKNSYPSYTVSSAFFTGVSKLQPSSTQTTTEGVNSIPSAALLSQLRSSKKR